MSTRVLARNRSALTLLAVGAAVGLLVSLLMIAGTATATHVSATFVAGNKSCGQLDTVYDHEFKIEPVTAGVHDDPASDFSVTLTLHDTSAGQTFDFDANLPVDAVFAKGGDSGNLYVYDPAETEDTGLHAPENPSGVYAGLSHISFCFNELPGSPPPPTPPTTPPEETPPTPPGGTTSPTGGVLGEVGTPGGAPVPDTSAEGTGTWGVTASLLTLILITSAGASAYLNVRAIRRRSG